MFGWTALSDDPEAVVVKVSEAVGGRLPRTALDEMHLSMKAFGDAIAFRDAPNARDFLLSGA